MIAVKAKTEKSLLDMAGLRTALLKDLQNRCEKVIELEMKLDEAHDQLNELAKGSSTKSLQKRVLALESNLKKLTLIHQQTVTQNQALQIDMQVAEKKLINRNKRIQDLESLMNDLQEVMATNEKKATEEITKLRMQVDEAERRTFELESQQRARAPSVVVCVVVMLVMPRVPVTWLSLLDPRLVNNNQGTLPVTLRIS